MSHPYDHRKHFLEYSPESDEDDGSKRVQTTFGADQNVSTQHYAYSYGVEDQFQQANQYSAQQAAQYTPRYQGQDMLPSQHYGDYRTGYTIHQPTQQSIEDPDEDPNEHSDEYLGEYSGEDPDEYSDGYSDENPEISLHRPRDDYPVDYLDDPPVENPVEYQTNYSTEQSIGDPNRHLDQVSEAHGAQGSYPTAGTSPVTQAFRSLGLTSFDAQPGPSQPYATPQAAGTWSRNLGVPALLNPMPDPSGSSEQPVTGYGQPAPEDELSGVQKKHVRKAIAYDSEFDAIAKRVDASVSSVQNFVNSNNLLWTPQQDVRLKEMWDQGFTMPDMVEGLESLPGAPRRFDHEVQSRVWWLESRGWPTQQAELAGSPQNDPRQYSMAYQPGGHLPPQTNQEVAAETMPGRGRWAPGEIRILGEWAAQHNGSFKGVENALPGRTSLACTAKWRQLRKDFPGHESSDQEQSGSAAGRAGHVRPVNPELQPDEICFLKNELARDVPLSALHTKHYPRYNIGSIRNALHKKGWFEWTVEEDEQVLELQQAEGDEWAHIGNKPGGASRSTEEVKIRHDFLKKLESGEAQRGVRAGRHRWLPEQDNKVRRRLARGKNCADIARKGFHGLSTDKIRKRAVHIKAVWTDEDDEKLPGCMNPEPDATFDWDSVGRQYNPERKGDVVKRRWKFLHGYEMSSSEDDES